MQANTAVRNDDVSWEQCVAILNRIRQLRIEEGSLSQARLAKQIDISRQTLHAIERARRLPSLEIAHRIADALHCSLDDVFHYESELPVDDSDDGQLTAIFSVYDGTKWWESDDVSRVTAVRSAVVTRPINRTTVRSQHVKPEVPGE